MIDLTINRTGLEHNLKKAREHNILIPTIAQMQHPETIPGKVQDKLKAVGLWDVNPLNLFRVTWTFSEACKDIPNCGAFISNQR